MQKAPTQAQRSGRAGPLHTHSHRPHPASSLLTSSSMQTDSAGISNQLSIPTGYGSISSPGRAPSCERRAGTSPPSPSTTSTGTPGTCGQRSAASSDGERMACPCCALAFSAGRAGGRRGRGNLWPAGVVDGGWWMARERCSREAERMVGAERGEHGGQGGSMARHGWHLAWGMGSRVLGSVTDTTGRIIE